MPWLLPSAESTPLTAKDAKKAAKDAKNLQQHALSPDVRLACMKAGDDPVANPKGTLSPGLYLVATPIGNLEDITLRAVRVLKEADQIACEDTRQTQKLLHHYGITTRTVSYHEHNELTRAPELVLDLEGGARVALVTDAGMPGISDPGFRLISLAIRHHIPVVPIPGASAFLAALVASGLPTDSFRFSGFLPPKSGQRRQMLESVKASPRTQVFYEAPHRVKEAIEDVVDDSRERIGRSSSRARSPRFMKSFCAAAPARFWKY